MLTKLKEKYPQSHVIEYAEKCKSGEIVIGKELMTQLDMLIDDFNSPAVKIELSDSEKRIKFIEEQCRHSEAPHAGKLFILMLFQKAFIEAIFAIKIYDEDLERYVRKYQDVLFLVGRKNGKALSLDTKIPTPSGWSTMRELDAGDYVFSQDGTPTKILKTSDIFYNHDCYKVKFEDGEEIIADSEHIWTVMTKRSRSTSRYKPTSNRKLLRPDYRDSGGYFDLTTVDMVKDFYRVRNDGKGIEYKYRVPMQKPIKYEEQNLLIDPYVLGVWLGDGESSGTRITCSDGDKEEMMSLVNASGYQTTWNDCKDRAGRFSISDGFRNGFKTKLREYSLINNKHIPIQYLTGSIHQRFELLKGLMDTDGYCSKNGECEFSQKSFDFINSFSELLSSLGIKHSVREKTIKCNGKMCRAYSVLFFCSKTNSCFKLKRKHDRLKDTLSPRMLNKSIINIEKVDSVPTKCIGVEHESQLYLAGSRMTATHNTPLIGAICLAEWFCGPEGCKILCASNSYDQADLMFQAIDAMRSESKNLEKCTRKNIKGMFFGNPRNPRKKGKRSYQNKGNIRKLSAKTGAKEGRNIAVGAVDEVFEMADDTLVMPIRQALSTQDEPLYWELTTEGFTDDGYLDKRLVDARKVLAGELERPRWLIWLYTHDSEEEIFQDERSWFKSNPGLKTIKKVSFLRQMLEEAKTSTSTRAFVLGKDFNLKQNSASAWLQEADVVNTATFSPEMFRGKHYIGSLDFAETTDLCNAKALFVDPVTGLTHTLSMYFIPESKADAMLEDDNKLNPEKKNYREWSKQGLVTICPGDEVDSEYVVKWFYGLYESFKMTPFKIGYDNWHAKSFKTLTEQYFGEGILEQIKMDFLSLSGPMRIVEGQLKDKKLNYGDNPIDRWCLRNTSFKTNNLGMIMPVKLHGQSKNRIDGSLGFIIAQATHSRYKTEYADLMRR